MDNEKTPYETNPVESPFDAICAFVEAYDVLLACLAEHGADADELRTAIFRPVCPESGGAPIGIYEIGVIFDHSAGKYGINRKKLNKALLTREADVRALFSQEDGILPNLCDFLLEFLGREESEPIDAATLRFLNECRRLFAMLA
ncbi:MAG: hypothetical protein FWC70_02975 [Defluviitaleaceae bacterium]|nr:hypothetical protein [Defluviitaleaceae bacterium]